MDPAQETGEARFRQMPKVELHLHLDCSLSYAVVSRLDPSVTRGEYQDRFIAAPKCANLADALTRAASGIQLMQTEEQLRFVVGDLFAQLVQDNVLYAEIRFAPLLHMEKGLSAADVVRAVESAVSEGIVRTGVEARLLLCTLRHYSEAESLETVKLVDEFRDTTVAGFDIAGDEAGFAVDAHVKAFRYARDNQIPCTAHAGEGAGPESVWQTLRNFAPSRLGHGVRSIEDPALTDYLRDSGVHLEVCPTCNVMIGICSAYESHPVDTLYAHGLPLSINTDVRTMANVTLCQEYERLHRAFGWEREHFLRCNTNALRAAFLPEGTRDELMVRLLDAYQ